MLSCLFALTTSRRVRHRRHLVSNAETVGTITSDIGVNIRSGPGTGYSIVGSAPCNAGVYIRGGSGQWWSVSYNGVSGYAHGDYINVPAYVSANGGLNMRSGPGTGYGLVCGIPDGASVTITCRSSDQWYGVRYGGYNGYCSSDYLKLSTSGGGGGSWPPSTKIRQGNSAFNSNIRQWGCGFMSCCWCGKVNSISGCNSLYDKALRIGAMRSDCYILNWDTMKQIAGARSYRYGSAGQRPNSNEKEILQCQNSRTSMHFVVGNGYGSVEYDPAYDGFVSYGDCVSKRFYAY